VFVKNIAFNGAANAVQFQSI